MKCDPVALSAYLDGELPQDDRRVIERHLAGCETCARELQRMERTRTMIATLVERPRFHRQLMLRVASEEEARGPGLWKLAAAAAVLLLLGCAVAYVMLSGFSSFEPESGPAQFAVTPSPEEPGAEAPLALSQLDEEKMPLDPVPERLDAAPGAASSEALEQTRLPLTLAGTTAGSTPTAVITRTTDDAQRVYAVGDTVLAGVQLVEVADRLVILDNAGNLEVLAFPDAPTVISAPSVDGLWASVAVINGQEEEGPLVRVTVSGTTLTAVGVTDNTRASGTLYGNHVAAAIDLGGGETISAEGDFNDARTELALATTAPGMGTIRLTKLENEALEHQLSLAEREREVRDMYSALGNYAMRNEGCFPDALAALAPNVIPDLSRFAETETRTVTYYPGERMFDANGLADGRAFSTFHPELTMPDRLMLWEKTLQEQFGQDALLAGGQTVLRVTYSEPEMVFVARAGGGVSPEEGTGSDAPLTDATPEGRVRLAAARASCQNNLKQLGLVIKMFENENYDYTPPGWLTTYPEYITDPSILTSPKDAPGTDSYVYLFPATNVEEMARETVSDSENPAARAKFLSEVPILLNRADFPGDTPGRNILFADGHVEYVRSPRWREVIEPWLSLSGVSVP